MKILLSFLLLLCCSSCADNVTEELPNEGTLNGYPIYVQIVDSCEYLVAGWGNVQVITHKGNCKHCRQQGR